MGLVNADAHPFHARIGREQHRSDFFRNSFDQVLWCALDNRFDFLIGLCIVHRCLKVIRRSRCTQGEKEFSIDEKYLPVCSLFCKASVIAEKFQPF